jgi:WD40 repeat protein
MGTPAGSGPRSMLQVMDVRTRKPLRNWQGNFTRDQVALSRDGKTLALPTEVNNVRQIQIWDATLANRPIRRLQFPGAEDSSVDLHALAFSNDGDRIAALIRIPNGRRLVCWQTGDGSVISDAAFPDITSTYLGGKSSQSSPIQWMRDDESVLLYGAMLVHVQTGRPVSLLETAGAVRSEYYQPNLLHVVRPSANNGQLNRIDELTLDLNALATIVQRARETGPLMVNPPGLPDSRLEWSTQRTTLLSSNSNANTRLPTPDPVVKPAAGFTNRPIPMSGSMEQLRDLVFPREGGQFAAAMYATVGIDRFHQTSEPLRAWVDKIDLATGRVESSTIVPMAARLIDISNDGSQLLLGSGRAAGTQNRFDRLDIWSTGSNGTHVAAIKAPANLTFDSAHFLGNDQILTRQGSTLVCWSIPQRRAIWAWANGIAGGPVFSPGGKYAVIAHDGRLRLMDTGRGAILMDLENPPVGASLSGNSCFSPDGRTFALMVGKNLFRWDITTGRAEPILESPAAGMIEYGSDSKHLLVGDQLVDPQTGQAIFAYDVRNGRHVHGGPGGRHWYLSTHPTDGTIYLCSTELPREQDLASAAAYAETPPLVRPGEALWVSVTGDSQINPTVQSVIQNRLKQAGFRIDENALVSVIVSARLGHSGGTVRINNGAETAELRQQVYACKVTYTDVNGKTLWEGKEWAVQAPKGFGAGVFIPTDEAENAYRKALAANVKLWAEMTELPEYVSETGGTTVRSRATLGVD